MKISENLSDISDKPETAVAAAEPARTKNDRPFDERPNGAKSGRAERCEDFHDRK